LPPHHGRFNHIRHSTLQSASSPYQFCPLLSHFEDIDRRACPGPATFPLEIATSRVRSGPLSNTCFLGLTQVHIPDSTFIGSPFLHSSWQRVPILYNGPRLPQLKIAPSHDGICIPSNTWFLGPTQIHTPKGISINSAIF